ncbi:MAG: DUF502 domain-containing protein [Pseudobdellovibrionaceae bacterium]
MSKFNKIFISGLVTLLPFALTIYLAVAAARILDSFLGHVLRLVLPEAFYIPGLGLLATVILIFLFGLLLNNYLTAQFLRQIEKRLTKIPFFKVVYSPLRDLMNLFSKKSEGHKSVVLVNWSNGMRSIGVVTREKFSDLPAALNDPESVAVYIPFSYGMGGYTYLVKRSQLTEVDMPIEQAMSLVITGWVKAETPTEEKLLDQVTTKI